MNDTCGDCIYFQSAWLCRKVRNTGGKNSPINNCPDFERKPMSNIKITAEVDGKQMPLENISTEIFEAIKALEKSKEIPVTRLATYSGSPRLLFKPTESIILEVGKIYALDLKRGVSVVKWIPKDDNKFVGTNYSDAYII